MIADAGTGGRPSGPWLLSPFVRKPLPVTPLKLNVGSVRIAADPVSKLRTRRVRVRRPSVEVVGCPNASVPLHSVTGNREREGMSTSPAPTPLGYTTYTRARWMIGVALGDAPGGWNTITSP